MRVAQWSGTSPNMLRAALLLVDHSGKVLASYNWTEGGAIPRCGAIVARWDRTDKRHKHCQLSSNSA